SKSAVNRYAVRMEEVGAKIREAREVSRMWIGELGSGPAGEVGKLLGIDIDALHAQACKDIPEPKSWSKAPAQAPKADPTPAAKKVRGRPKKKAS
ncbi:MAG: phage protein Gp27 family protein, partial [Desulfobulbaceae bacterium]